MDTESTHESYGGAVATDRMHVQTGSVGDAVYVGHGMPK